MEDISSLVKENKILTNLKKDVLLGLTSNPKRIPSKYFYDEKGSKLFERIMELPEYYPTACETEIFHKYKASFLAAMNGEAFQLLDLGAGDGAKTKILIDYFSNEKANFTYVPIDIDGNILKSLQENLEKDYPALNLKPVNAEYREALEWLKINSKQKKMVLFMGGNIGNFEKGAALDFLSGMKEALNPGDLLLTGIDLKKDPKTILNAYDDPKGVTAEFNYNLLERINRELEADFVISQWQHYATYDPVSGATQSFLVSKIKQQVNIQGLDSTFHFDSWEPIHTEYSMKYAIEEINQMAGKCGFERVENYFSAKNWFVDALWRVA